MLLLQPGTQAVGRTYQVAVLMVQTVAFSLDLNGYRLDLKALRGSKAVTTLLHRCPKKSKESSRCTTQPHAPRGFPGTLSRMMLLRKVGSTGALASLA